MSASATHGGRYQFTYVELTQRCTCLRHNVCVRDAIENHIHFEVTWCISEVGWRDGLRMRRCAHRGDVWGTSSEQNQVNVRCFANFLSRNPMRISLFWRKDVGQIVSSLRLIRPDCCLDTFCYFDHASAELMFSPWLSVYFLLAE